MEIVNFTVVIKSDVIFIPNSLAVRVCSLNLTVYLRVHLFASFKQVKWLYILVLDAILSRFTALAAAFGIYGFEHYCGKSSVTIQPRLSSQDVDRLSNGSTAICYQAL